MIDCYKFFKVWDDMGQTIIMASSAYFAAKHHAQGHNLFNGLPANQKFHPISVESPDGSITRFEVRIRMVPVLNVVEISQK